MQTEDDFPQAFSAAGIEGQFTRDGYVVLPFFNKDEVAACRKLYFDTITEPPADFFTTGFLPDSEPRRKVKEALERIIAPHIAGLMPTYCTCVGHFIVKRGGPDAGPLHLHQDFNFVDQSIQRAVHVWIALADVDERNGCLTVLPGSHKLGFHISAMGLNATPYDPYHQVFEDDCKVAVPMKAGEALFFDERTLHGSCPNTSPDVRIAMGAVFLPNGVKQRLYIADDVKSALLDVLEVEDETLLNYNALLRPPYPKGFRKIGTVEYMAKILSPEVVQSLKRVPAARRDTRRLSMLEVQPPNSDPKWQEIASRGYTVQPFLERPEIEALQELYAATTPEVVTPFFLSVLLPVDARRAILEGFRTILHEKLGKAAPGFRIVAASFVTKKAGSVNGRLGLHQDCSLVDHNKHLSFNVWVPLCDTDAGNGCLRVAPHSQRFNSISCLPPVCGALAHFERELTSPYITTLQMRAGEACLFDARVLHASEENQSDRDRVAAFFNLIPEDQPIRLSFRNPESPNSIEVYHVDSEFILQLNPLEYPDAEKRATIKHVETIPYVQRTLSLADFAALHRDLSCAPPFLSLTEKAETTPIEAQANPLSGSIWGRLRRRFQPHRVRTQSANR